MTDEFCPYLFIKEPFYEDFLVPIEKSTPDNKTKFYIQKIIPDFNFGEFKIIINSGSLRNIEIKLIKNSINDFWKFLEFVVLETESLFFKLFYNGYETFIYIKPLDKKNLRFVLLNTYDLEQKILKGEIQRHSYKMAKVILDVEIKKKDFIKIFYSKLHSTFKNFESTALFEPPVTDFNSWIKDSEVLKNFIQ